MKASQRTIDAIRAVRIGPFGPNAMAIIAAGGATRLTPNEAEQIYAAVIEARKEEDK